MAIKANSDGAVGNVVVVTNGMDDEETAGNTAEFAAIGALCVRRSGDNIDRYYVLSAVGSS